MPAQLPTRKIGTTDVTAIGFGAMGIGGFSYTSPDAEKDNMKVSIFDSPLPFHCSYALL